MEDISLHKEVIMQYLDIKVMTDFMIRFNKILKSSKSNTEMLVSLIILKEQIPYLEYFSQDLSNIDEALNALIAGLIPVEEQIECNNEFIKELMISLSLFNKELIEKFLEQSVND